MLKPFEVMILLSLLVLFIIVVILIHHFYGKKRGRTKQIILLFSSIYIVFAFSFLVMRSNDHKHRYEELQGYLQQAYPEQNYTIHAKNLREVVQLGDFDVIFTNRPNKVYVYRVKKDGSILQMNDD